MEEQKISIDNLSINYKTFGQGRAVLVLHGWGKGSDSWVEVGELLAKKDFQVIIPDLPGFGKSGEPKNPWTVADYFKFVEDFVAALGLDKFDIIGHSFGGGLVAVYAAQNPQKVNRLILCDSAIIRQKRLSLRQIIAQKISPAGKFFAGLPFAGGVLPLARKLIYKIAGVSDYQSASPVMKKTFQNIVGQDLASFTPQILAPTLIIWGRNDQDTALEDAFKLNKIITGSKLKIIENCGHNPHRTHPQILAQNLIDFLE